MKNQRLRYRIEAILSVVSGALLVLTLIVPDWIERIFGFEPDGGDGSTEWGLTILLAVVTLVFVADTLRLRSNLSRN